MGMRLTWVCAAAIGWEGPSCNMIGSCTTFLQTASPQFCALVPVLILVSSSPVITLMFPRPQSPHLCVLVPSPHTYVSSSPVLTLMCPRPQSSHLCVLIPSPHTYVSSSQSSHLCVLVPVLTLMCPHPQSSHLCVLVPSPHTYVSSSLVLTFMCSCPQSK